MAESPYPLIPADRLFLLSDLHLSDDTPLTLSALSRLLATQADAGVAFVLLGDIFEYWVGDDHHTATAETVATACQAAHQRGATLYFMPGNRDFLLGSAYAARCHLQILSDPWFGLLAGMPTWLSHGDLLCTDDTAYQQFRQMSRTEAWQTQFMTKPLSERIAYAEYLRAESKKTKAAAASDIMDVNPDAVERAFIGQWPAPAQKNDQAYLTDPATAPTPKPLATRLIHGHTHRPARHALTVAGVACERWVLPDWDFDGAGRSGAARENRGYALAVSAGGIEFSRPPAD